MTTLTMHYIKGDFVVPVRTSSQPGSRRAERPRTGAWRTTRARAHQRDRSDLQAPQRERRAVKKGA
jgi:hypothetical protein